MWRARIGKRTCAGTFKMSGFVGSRFEMSMAPYMSTFSRNGKVRKKYQKNTIWASGKSTKKYEENTNPKLEKYKVRTKIRIKYRQYESKLRIRSRWEVTSLQAGLEGIPVWQFKLWREGLRYDIKCYRERGIPGKYRWLPGLPLFRPKVTPTSS